MNRDVIRSCLALVGACFFAAVHTSAATIVTVPVGNPGNNADTVPGGEYGSVAYAFRIAKYEVTNAQYVEFLNGVDSVGVNTLAVYATEMTTDARGGILFSNAAPNGFKYSVKPGRDNNPVIYVSCYDAMRFANWLQNGQGNGDTENGAYTLGPLDLFATPINGVSITRNQNATWWLPSDDEWYKAAYHKNDGVTGNYYDYPMQIDDSGLKPQSDQPPGTDATVPSHTGNFFNKFNGPSAGYDDGYAVTGSITYDFTQNYLTDVGAYTFSAGPYGTFDQGGNVWEWNEDGSGGGRHYRGGAWNGAFSFLLAGGPNGAAADYQSYDIGFRVATVAVTPEPCSLAIVGFGIFLSSCFFHRFAREAEKSR
jgi:formylglycine-generating enzyme required for sulfatase activity